MISFFKVAVYTPIYNGLVFLIDILPGGDVGFAVILITIFVKLVLFPLSLKAYRTQILMKGFNQEIDQIKNKYKDDRNKQAEAIMNFYRDKKVNPFASLVVLFIQIPIVISLYYVFYKGGLPTINPDLLYSFVPNPDHVNTIFLGIFDTAGKSVFLAFVVGLTQFLQMKIAMPELAPKDPNKRPDQMSFKDNMARGFQFQMRYVMPVVLGFIAYSISSAVSLYWTTSNIFAIGQELYLRRKFKKNDEKNPKTEQN